jgi:hypothetical protein
MLDLVQAGAYRASKRVKGSTRYAVPLRCLHKWRGLYFGCYAVIRPIAALRFATVHTFVS